MRRTTALLALVIATIVPFRESAAAALALDGLLDAEGAFWSWSPEEAERKVVPLGFQWVSAEREALRSAAEGMTWREQPVREALIRMQGERPAALVLSVYNRGDAGSLAREAFQSAVSNAQAALAAWFGAPGRASDDQLNTSGVRRHALVWQKPPHRAQLAWSYSTKDENRSLTYRPEFIRITFAPAASAPVAALPGRPGSAAPPRISGAELKARVARTSDGLVAIQGIPMVDQGEKGYCSVATLERVLRYYGIATDQHELAQLAASSASRGTSPDAMVDSLKRVGSKMGFRLRVVEDFDPKDFLKLIDRYNGIAKKNKTTQLDPYAYREVSAYYQLFEYPLLKEARLKARIDQEKFEREVAKSVDQGIPLAWSVVVGKVEEQPPVHGQGGHMRLIHGYNPVARELAYSDSWGYGHEDKRMALDDAWTITTGLYVIEPLAMRP